MRPVPRPQTYDTDRAQRSRRRSYGKASSRSHSALWARSTHTSTPHPPSRTTAAGSLAM
ncbi:hypothetical protein CBM2589_B40089 [Cupriavidus taiwanensis]|uniref:Uncharacterized protein n=1 Tax=Cupriavidus taiwanensis TaxID=164546 RepID=A0A375BWC9_9BURK|nr:hypothetical protein CBM2589_B40089 [Cupriavidus taiwanensis]